MLLYLISVLLIVVVFTLTVVTLAFMAFRNACRDCPYQKHCRDLESQGKLNECAKEIINHTSD